MTHDEVTEVEAGKIWLEDLILKSRNVKVPSKYLFLKRRIQQLKCTTLYFKTPLTVPLKLVVRYLLGSGFILYLIAKSKFSKTKKTTGSFSIWDSDIDAHVSCEVFNEFLSSKQVVSIDSESFVFVRSAKYNKSFEKSYFSQNPILDTLFFLDFTFKDFLVVLKDLIKNFTTYIRILILIPDARGIFKDFLTEPVIKLYTRKGLKKFYRTNSSFDIQEFWCENIDFNTVWYSINSRSIQYKNFKIANLPDNPFYYFIHLGTSWTWNEMHSRWLKAIYDHKVNVVGPIMFYSITSKEKKTNIKKRLIVFDVTPCEDSYIREHVIQNGFNYYNEKYCLKFMKDIFEAFENENWEIVLKPKRKYVSFHSKKYLDFLSLAENKNNRFKVLPADTNLFNEILNSDLVISIPFSSPFDIANSMDIPALYLDPSGDVDFEKMGYSKNHYSYDSNSLKNEIKNLLY